MLTVILSGCHGAMGKMIAELMQERPEEFTLAAGVDKVVKPGQLACPVYESFQQVMAKADVLIDFSHHSLLPEVIAFIERTKTPAVIGTTGLDEAQVERLKQVAQRVPIMQTGNMSVGINLLLELVKQAAKVLHDRFDIEIIEMHHNRKVDAPSGTAKMLANAINSALDTPKNFTYGRHGKQAKRQPDEIGIHAVRGGTIVGEHHVIFAGPDEILELHHSAASRKVFAAGALRAATFVATKTSGFYTMSDVLQA